MKNASLIQMPHYSFTHTHPQSDIDALACFLVAQNWEASIFMSRITCSGVPLPYAYDGADVPVTVKINRMKN